MEWLGGIFVGVGLSVLVVGAVVKDELNPSAAQWVVLIGVGLIVVGALMA